MNRSRDGGGGAGAAPDNLLHTDGIRHADLDAGVRVLNELIFECQRSLEGIEHARLDLEAQANARAQGYGRP